MNWIHIDIAIIAAFLYYRRNKVVAASNLSGTSQYFRLWLLPLFQLLASASLLFFSYVELDMLLRQSPYMDQMIRDNLGIFSNIASDMFNDYRSGKLSPRIESMNNLHRYATYIFYISIALFVFHIYVLKNKLCSKQIVFGFAFLFTVVILILDYHYLYNSSKNFSAILSTETLGLFSLFGKGENAIIESSVNDVCKLGLVLFFFHYYHNIWLCQYYERGDETNINVVTSSADVVDSSNELSDDNKYQNLKELKALLDAGILTKEEFDSEKKNILNS